MCVLQGQYVNTVQFSILCLVYLIQVTKCQENTLLYYISPLIFLCQPSVNVTSGQCNLSLDYNIPKAAAVSTRPIGYTEVE